MIIVYYSHLAAIQMKPKYENEKSSTRKVELVLSSEQGLICL